MANAEFAPGVTARVTEGKCGIFSVFQQDLFLRFLTIVFMKKVVATTVESVTEKYYNFAHVRRINSSSPGLLVIIGCRCAVQHSREELSKTARLFNDDHESSYV